MSTPREIAEELMDWINEVEPLASSKDIGEALYTLSEAGAWPDYVDSVSPEQAIICWKIVERIGLAGKLPKMFKL
jgi:hypothetical protein